MKQAMLPHAGADSRLFRDIKALGAGPAPINFNEVYSSLQTKVVEGEENPLPIIATARLYEVQKYCSLTGHVWDGYVILGNHVRLDAKWRVAGVEVCLLRPPRLLWQELQDHAACAPAVGRGDSDDLCRPQPDPHANAAAGARGSFRPAGPESE